ncbi:MAG: GMC family oxidoreductase [Bacteroidetes bacterium]|nr:GMC family oxidoreductase [Bacteroidota bacterium]
MRDTSYDIIIVGSGVGGGTVADYLSRAGSGLRIAIIESGPFRKKEHFNQREIDMTALYYNRGAVLSENMEIGVAAANTVGGSSAVYTGVSFRPPESVLNRWRREFGMEFLTAEYVNRSLDEIEEDLNVHELPEREDNENNRLFRKGADALGIPVKRLKINTKGCLKQGFCNLGCTSGAKQGTLEVQIPRVLKRGVTLIYNAVVRTVEENAVNLVVRKAPENTIPNEIEEGEHRLYARYIILAAGTLNTPAILLRSAKKLHVSNPNMGRYLTLHPAFNINGIYTKTITNYRGFPKTWYIDAFSDSDGFYLETSFYFPGVTAKNNPGYGSMHRDIMRCYSKMMSILILIHDEAEYRNRIATDRRGNTVIDYTVSDSVRKSMIRALQESTKILFAAGCEKALIPGSDKTPVLPEDVPDIHLHIAEQYLNLTRTPLSSAHPQGGARMGTTPKHAVTDISGKVFGTQSIYVSDASLFPGSVKVNPYETVMLLAKWVAENVLEACLH